MVDGGLFDALEALARGIRGNQEPFGGIQLILAGDMSIRFQTHNAPFRHVFFHNCHNCVFPCMLRVCAAATA